MHQRLDVASRTLSQILLFAALAIQLTGTGAQTAWPQRPVQFVVPFPAGGGTDIIARTVAAKLQPILGQSVVIDNRAGASGIIGTQAVAKAAPDGYNFVLGVTNTHAINPYAVPSDVAIARGYRPFSA